MERRQGWAVRLALGMLLAASLALAFVPAAQAGTPDAPEVADPRGDVEGPNGAPACQTVPANPATGGENPCGFAPGFVDLAAGWVANETATDVQLYIDSGNNANVYGSADYDFHFTVAGTEYVAGMHAAISDPSGQVGSGATSPTGVATAAAWNDDTYIQISVPKSAIGSPAAGASMTALFLTSHLDIGEQQEFFTDSTDPGLDYVFTGGSTTGGNVTAGDTDGDGLNDTCETKYFGSLNATSNASADPDGDGLTNGQECALGTDPTNPDSDGDGVDDKNDPYPTDATRGGTSGSSSTSSTSRSSSTSRAPTSSTSGSKGSVTDLAGAIDKLQSDVGYLGMSAGGFLAVLVLCIIGLAVRWSL